jgi:hypothetical protein
MADIIAAAEKVAKGIPETGWKVLLDCGFILAGALAVGLLISILGIANYVPASLKDWVPEITFILCLLLVGVAHMTGITEAVRLAMGAALAAGLYVIQKWAAKFGLKLNLAGPTNAMGGSV